MIIYGVKGDRVNSSPNDEMVDLTKLKEFADDKLNVAKVTSPLLDGVENTVEKG